MFSMKNANRLLFTHNLHLIFYIVVQISLWCVLILCSEGILLTFLWLSTLGRTVLYLYAHSMVRRYMGSTVQRQFRTAKQ